MKIPGFVDLQVNGYMGVDFSNPDLTEERFKHACREILASGTAAFLATLVTSSEDTYKRNLPLIAKVISSDEFKNQILGIHLEGPFISSAPGAVGAHNLDFVRSPSITHLDRLLDLAQGQIKLLTIAAELEGADELAKNAVKNRVAVSLGHQMALEDDMKRLSDAGATALTHLGNGLPNEIHRHRNPIWAGIANENLSAMIITDSHHLPDSVIISVIKAKGPSKIIIVSDASPLAGMPPGNYRLWGADIVLEKSGYLYRPDRNCMVGSSATMLECMNYLASIDLINEEELLKVGFHNPLELINVDASTIMSEKSLCWNETPNRFEFAK